MKVYRIILISVSILVVLSGCSNKKQWEEAVKERDQIIVDLQKQLAAMQQIQQKYQDQIQSLQQNIELCQEEKDILQQDIGRLIKEKYIQPQDKKTETTPIPQTDAITKMTTVFQGGYSKSHIKSKLDQMMTLYNLPITEEYYNRVGSVLVGLENEYGVPEMDILQCVIDAHTPGVKMEFTSTAALCTIMIKNK